MSGESAPVLLIPASAPHSRQTLNMHSILHFADMHSDCVCAIGQTFHQLN